MQTLFKAPAASPRVREVTSDERNGVIAVTESIESKLTSGWDAFEVWRTRVKTLQVAPERPKRRS